VRPRRAVTAPGFLVHRPDLGGQLGVGALAGSFAEFDAAYRRMMPEPYPVRTTVGSTLAGILVEIDFVAVA
jgi:hypothetical protein